MRRVFVAIVLSIAAVAPGIAWQEGARGQDREAPRGWEKNRERRSPANLRQERGFASAQAGVCQPNFGSDISILLSNAPGNGWLTVPGDCSGQPGCNDFFILSCSPGSLVQASFCSNGGSAFWNTNLSVWEGGSLQLCEDDTCGLQSAIAHPYSGSSFQRFKIGGTNDDSGTYTLAVNIPANCSVGGGIGVELQSFDVG